MKRNVIKTIRVLPVVLLMGILCLAPSVHASQPNITSVVMNPSTPDFGQEVTVSIDYCANFYAAEYIAIAVSQFNTVQPVGTMGQIFVVNSQGVDVHSLDPGSGGGPVGMVSNTANGYTPNTNCLDCSSSGGLAYTREYVFHIPDKEMFDACTLTTLYIHIGMSDFTLYAGDWQSLAACRYYSNSWDFPIPPPGFKIHKRSTGLLNGDGSLILYEIEYDYANGALTITDPLPAGDVLRFVSAGPASFLSGYPAKGQTSGTIIWDLPDRTSLPGGVKGKVWILAEQNGGLSQGTVIQNGVSATMSGVGTKNSTTQNVVGRPVMNVRKSQSIDMAATGDTVTYFLDYSINGRTLASYDNFDSTAFGTYSVNTPPPGWKFKKSFGETGSWTISDPCADGDRMITADITGEGLYPSILVDDGSAGDDTDQFCTGIIEADVSIDPGGYAGADARVDIRVNDQEDTSMAGYSLNLSIDNIVGTATGYIGIQFCIDGSCTFPSAAASSNPVILPNVWYKTKTLVEQSGNDYVFSVKVWRRGDPEPESWIFTWTHAGGAAMPELMCAGGSWTDWRPGLGLARSYYETTNSYDNFAVYKGGVAAASPVLYDTIPAGIVYVNSTGGTESGGVVSWSPGSWLSANGHEEWWGRVVSTGLITNKAGMDDMDPSIPAYSNEVILSVPAITFTNTPEITVQGTPTITQTITPTENTTPDLPSVPFDLQISTSGDMCSNSQMSFVINIINTGLVDADMTSLCARIWVYDNRGQSLVTTVNTQRLDPWQGSGTGLTTALSYGAWPDCIEGGRNANQYAQIWITGTTPNPVESGRFAYIAGTLRWANWQAPFDDVCDDYSRLQSFPMGSTMYVALYQNGQLVAEETSPGVPDENSGIEPCYEPTILSPTITETAVAGSFTYTPTRTSTRTSTPTGTATKTRTVTPTITLTPVPALTGWVDVDGVGTESMNVTNSGNLSKDVTLKYDSSGNPHIVYVEDGDIHYMYWDGSAWKVLGGSSDIFPSAGVSRLPDMILSVATDYPIITWTEDVGNYEIYFLMWNGTAWVDADGSGQESVNISNNAGASDYAAIAADSSGRPHVVWMDSTGGYNDIYYLKWNGSSWVDADGSGRESVDINATGNNSLYPDIEIDGSNNIYIAWNERVGIPYQIYHQYWDGVSWKNLGGSPNISNTAGNATWVCIDLDSNGYLNAAWMDDVGGDYDIYYKRWNGTAWQDIDGAGPLTDVVYDNSSASSSPSLQLDNNDYPHIAWYDDTLGNYDIYYIKWDGTAWVDADGPGPEPLYINSQAASDMWPSLALLNGSDPKIAWAVSGTNVYFLQYLESPVVSPTITQTITPTLTPEITPTNTPHFYIAKKSAGNTHNLNVPAQDVQVVESGRNSINGQVIILYKAYDNASEDQNYLNAIWNCTDFDEMYDIGSDTNDPDYKYVEGQ